MTAQISDFTITKLFGYRTVKLQMRDNTLILVGDNGSGKTTCLRLLYFVLSGQWASMVRYQFDEVRLTIASETFRLRRADLEKLLRGISDTNLRRYPMAVRSRLVHLLEQREGELVTPELERLADEYGIPLPILIHELDEMGSTSGEADKGVRKTLKAIARSFDISLVYLPTYRRIEHELHLILKGLDERELRHRRERLSARRMGREKGHVELVEFGMNDVEDAFNKTLVELSKFARESLNELTFGYLGDIVEERYDQVDLQVIRNASDDRVEKILDRVQTHILSSENKKHLRETIQSVREEQNPSYHAKVICHYFTKLMEYQVELEKLESRVRSFCDVCNNYLIDKQLVYEPTKFTLGIFRKDQQTLMEEVKLQNLSSGEKQIVSLFSHLYLLSDNKYFVLIDEPELSLSVPWQRRFLQDIRNADHCDGLVAVTHSPFIYDNDLRKHARALGEFEL